MMRFSILAVLGLVVFPGTAFAQRYELIDLGPDVKPADISNSGWIVGSLPGGPSGSVAFRFSAQTRELEVLPGGSAAKAVTEAGLVVGNTPTGAFLYTDGTFVSLGAEVTANGINEHGLACGTLAGVNPHRPTPRPIHPAMYDIASEQWTFLDIARVYPRGTRQGIYADVYWLEDVNDAGNSIGTRSRTGLYGSSPILIGPAFDGVSYLPIPNGGSAVAINSGNLVVGTTGSDSSNDIYPHAYSYDVDAGTYRDLGTLFGGLTSGATDVNDHGQIVGTSWLITYPTSEYNPEDYHAFLFADGAMDDLNLRLPPAGAGWILTSATAINDSGDIAGVGLLNGRFHGYALVMRRPSSVDPGSTAEPATLRPARQP